MLPPTTHQIPHSLPLTLVVATTPIRVASSTSNDASTRLGIGLKGTLPWPRIKADMSFFARTTSRAPAAGTTNAIIMGRKTYDSVPKHLRPLGKRISVIVTRDTSGSVREGVLKELEARKMKMAETAKAKAQAAAAEGKEVEQNGSTDEPITDALVTHSLDSALSELDAVYGASGRLGKIYIIGGAEIYGAALRMKAVADATQTKRPVRIVMTNIVRKAEGEGAKNEFECDTFFPVQGLTPEDGWRTASPAEVSEWVGETVTGEWIQEGEVEVQMVGYERLD
ncbi:uncharacterized protein N7482_010452 [Penicillium canariense]|uniref:Dihydrofolate reductase n=1 Tax=Penicillium canariense TaxID=189055 RepID=A0A9W9HLU5_9EURO|nr:uncharacterized protein N7482_010452 [Penicillium canariense]KAJ5151200.1 hypothetical protein N7482_010452 [Penicillium canariense]